MPFRFAARTVLILSRSSLASTRAGLGKASGRRSRPLFDNQLGLLDLRCWTHLAKCYFLRANHQVLLLSNDEEITERYYAEVRPPRRPHPIVCASTSAKGAQWSSQAI